MSDPAWTGKSVIVTGASGFIGRHVVAALAEAGARVTALSRRERPDETGVAWRVWDSSNGEALARLIRDVDGAVVFHLASHVTGRRGVEEVLPAFRGNTESAIAVMSAAVAAGNCRVILAGSMEEPDPAGSPVPASPYAASKWAASGYARMFHALYGVPVAVARIFMVYGPGPQDEGKFVPYVCRSALAGEPPALMSGSRPVDWVFVSDVARGLLALGQSPVIDGSSVDIGSGQPVTTGELATRICALAGTGVSPEFGAVPDRKLEQVRVADPEATRELIGWSPVVSLDEGLQNMLDWCRSTDESR